MSVRLVVRPAVPGDLAPVAALLREAGLCVEDLEGMFPDGFAVAARGSEIAGACGVEEHHPFGLLRSAVVSPRRRGRSIGSLLVNERIRWARLRGLRSLYLLTLDADRYFEQFRFRRVDRAGVPTEIQHSTEFRSLCPASAIVMARSLERPERKSTPPADRSCRRFGHRLKEASQ